MDLISELSKRTKKSDRDRPRGGKEMKCNKCGGEHSYPHEKGCQFCNETRPHHHEWGEFGQRTVLEKCTPPDEVRGYPLQS